MKTYYIEGYAGWYVINAKNKRIARSSGIQEFGKGNNIKIIREATEKEIEYYKQSHGEIDTAP